MGTMIAWVQSRFIRDERGASLTEYALLLALIAAVAIGVVTLLGNDVTNAVDSVEDKLGGDQG